MVFCKHINQLLLGVNILEQKLNSLSNILFKLGF